jgi:hypothetical protein
MLSLWELENKKSVSVLETRKNMAGLFKKSSASSQKKKPKK